jgi:small ligand-binding sensory domain FIST
MTRVAAGLSTASGTTEAVAAAASEAAARLDGRAVDVAFLFATPHHLEQAPAAAAAVRAELRPRHLIGCVAEGVIGGEREVESGPAIAVWAASLPGARIEPFHVSEEAGDAAPELAAPALVVLLVDPFTCPASALIERLNIAYPNVPLVGGIATGGGHAGAQALILDGDVHEGGAVGLAVAGVPVEVVVSQGCAPLGREAVITQAEGNIVFELAGQPALERLKETIGALSERERALAARGLLAGVVIDENKPDYGRGDFLMRGILGADEESGALAIGEQVRVGQTVRFHARDATSADEDLRLALDDALTNASGRPAGALLFSCNGRGTNMFDRPDHDSLAVAAALPEPALAGFFCGGEIGPVGGRSFLHGFTATMAIFLDDQAASGS